MIVNGCLYLARKIRAAICGEVQPEKPVNSVCGLSKAWKEEKSQEKVSKDSMFESEPKGAVPSQAVGDCRS